MPGYTHKNTHKASGCFDQYGYSDSREKKTGTKKKEISRKHDVIKANIFTVGQIWLSFKCVD